MSYSQPSPKDPASETPTQPETSRQRPAVAAAGVIALKVPLILGAIVLGGVGGRPDEHPRPGQVDQQPVRLAQASTFSATR